MKIRILFLTLLFLNVFNLAKAQNKKYDNSICWEVRKTETSPPSYVLGSIHVIDTTKIDFPIQEVRNLIDKAGILCLELSNVEMNLVYEKIQEKAYLVEREKNIANSLDEIRFKKLNSMIDSSHYFLKSFKDMLDYVKPSYLGMMILLEKQTKKSSMYGNYNFSPEGFFTSYAEANKIAVKGLETADEQVDFIVKPNLTFAQSMKKLEAAIDEFDKKDSNKIDMFLNYSNQNLHLLQDKDYLESTMIIRNKKMADGIDKLIDQHPIFVIIGAAHLPYENGVLKLLSKKGYSIKPYSINLKKR